MAVLTYDQYLLEEVSARFNLRKPNAEGLRRAVFELSGREQTPDFVLEIATGVGKTWLLAALLEYAAHQGVRNLLVVLPGRTVRAKTIDNFTPGSRGFISGAEIPKVVITPDNHTQHAAAINDPDAVKLFLMNIDHLVRPAVTPKPGTQASRTTRMSRPQESIGAAVLDRLQEADDLFVVLDESHSYSASARVWNTAITNLKPAARIGLTATPDHGDNVIYRYTLAKAIKDQYVKAPVVALRKEGYPDNEQVGMLRDAKKLLDIKTEQYRAVEARLGLAPINPIMLVSCRDTSHADEVADMLKRPDILGDEGAVLIVHSKNLTDEIEQKLADVQQPSSDVRAIVQVDMLNQGWNVHNVAVLVPLRALESGVLTEQMIGRGLRLPYGEYVNNEWVDTLDILSHESINKALERHGLTDPARQLENIGQPAAVGSTSSIPTASAAPMLLTRPDLGGGVIKVPAVTTQIGENPDTGQVALGLSGEAGQGGMRNIEGIVTAGNTEPQPQVKVELRDAEPFLFPKADFATEPRRLNLMELDDTWRREVAASFGEDFTDPIARSLLIVDDKGQRVRLNTATTADIEPVPMDDETVEANLVSMIRKMPPVKNGSQGEANRAFTPRLVQDVMRIAGGQWNMHRLTNAMRQFEIAIRKAASDAAQLAVPQPKITPLSLPKRGSYLLPPGDHPIPHSEVTAKNFDPRQYYGGWSHRARYSASRFDAYATELRIARLLDADSSIAWWMRLEHSDGASISYGAERRYYPDFVALDTAGMSWIIEGKSIKGRDDQEVQQKRKAAELVVRTMVTVSDWPDNPWGYLIAYQDDVENAGSWKNLREVSGAVTM